MSIQIECEICEENLDDRDFVEKKEKIVCWKCGWEKSHKKPIEINDFDNDWYYSYTAAGFDYCTD